MTDILIPDSWELPSYLAGDLIPMDRYRDRERSTIPDDDWEQGQDARVFNINQKMDRARTQHSDIPVNHWENTLNDIEQYDPEKHGGEPAELYSQKALDTLHGSGFYPVDSGVWHRKSQAGPTHILSYNPGLKDSEGQHIPWHVTTDPEQVGSVHNSLGSALEGIKADLKEWGRAPKHAGLYLAVRQSPGQRGADDWLERHSPESFEHDPRAEAHGWMDQNAHQYEEWHPSPGDYTYHDYGDAAGQSFHGDESRSHALPGSAYDPEPQGMSDDDWERFHGERESRHPDLIHETTDGGEPEEEDVEDDLNLGNHGFNWEAKDSTAGTSENSLSPETPGHYVKHQIDPDDGHVATHYIEPHENGRWSLHTDLGEHGLPVAEPTSSHGSLDWALHKYKQNSAEAMLPRYGYEPTRGSGGGVVRWSKTDPAHEEDYDHDIEFPDHGFGGKTFNHTHFNRSPSFSSDGFKHHVSDDLTDVVREQQRLGQGIHPGGHQDYRVTKDELLADPSVSRLGEPSTASDNFWGDGKIGSANWRIPHPTNTALPISAEATYNWDKGGYDFKYTHDGVPMYPTSQHFPAGAPIHVPGRQTRIPVGS